MATGKLLSPRQEKFCHRIIEGMGQVQAAKSSGYLDGPGINAQATNLLKNPKIKARIERLNDEAVYQANVTVVSLAEDLDKAWKLAFINKKPEACIQATITKAKLFGMLSDKQPATTVDLTIINKPMWKPGPLIEMSVDEWQAEYSPHETTNGHGSN